MPVKKTAVAKKTAPRKTTAAKTTDAAKRTTVAKASGSVRIANIMAKSPQTCRTGDSVAAAASWMWQTDCGSLPVLDDGGKLCGWITDRDISMALGMRPARATDLQVEQVMNGPAHRCRMDAKVADALSLMAEKQVRRLAVVDETEKLVGIVSIADLVRAAKPRASADAPSVAQVFETLRAIGRPHQVTTKV